jgi:hypothetical protein
MKIFEDYKEHRVLTICREKIQFIDHTFSGRRIGIGADKTEKVNTLSKPKTTHDIRRFL